MSPTKDNKRQDGTCENNLTGIEATGLGQNNLAVAPRPRHAKRVSIATAQLPTATNS